MLTATFALALEKQAQGVARLSTSAGQSGDVLSGLKQMQHSLIGTLLCGGHRK